MCVCAGIFQSLPGEQAKDASRRAEVYCKSWTAAKDIIEVCRVEIISF